MTTFTTRQDLENLCAQFAAAIERLPLRSNDFAPLQGALQHLEGAIRISPIVDPAAGEPFVTQAGLRATSSQCAHGLPKGHPGSNDDCSRLLKPGRRP